VTSFAALGLAEPLVNALNSAGLVTPTPIQAQAIPHLLDGRDLVGLAQTGTGKTVAFALPLIQQLAYADDRVMPGSARALVLAPTRELVQQIADAFVAYAAPARLKVAVVFGGVGMFPQIKTLSRGVDILVATPGRLIDLMQQKAVRLDHTKRLVLDEADRMLDMGFVRDVMKIVDRLPKHRHTLLFSATMPDGVRHLVSDLLDEPVEVAVTPEVITVERIEQRVYHVSRSAKRGFLVDLLANPAMKRVVVFTRTKHGANRLAEQLETSGIAADAIHGNKSQGARQRALSEFKAGALRVLVATDIVSRGIDVDDVTHVINYELPNEPESYVHRIGRTARAGRDGIALSFCDHEERGFLRDIEKLTGLTIEAEAVDIDLPKPRGESTRRGDDTRGGKSAGKSQRAGKPGYAKTGPHAGSGGKPNRSDRPRAETDGAAPHRPHHASAETRAAKPNHGESNESSKQSRSHRRQPRVRAA
jgi:ATP-dependent RNA helicase RhlE